MRLNINVDHVATLREARRGTEPDPVTAAILAELAGADGIVVHLREDRRHVKKRDLFLLKKTVKTRLNMEMAVTEEMIAVAAEAKPDMVTLVPEKREEITTEGGLDILAATTRTGVAVEELKNLGLFVSVFIDPEAAQIRAARETGADMVELHTGSYSNAGDEAVMIKELEKIRDSAAEALSLGLRVSAGHGLDYSNAGAVSGIEEIEELNIGHSVVSRAVFHGMEKAVRDMIFAIRDCKGDRRCSRA